MTERAPTCIGRVRHVLGSTVTVALDNDMAGVAPIYRGQVLSIGQIGSLVRIPQGLVDLIASVSLLGIAELSGDLEPAGTVQRDERWLQVQLLGEIDLATGQFQRGVASYPALDDEVHFATIDQLSPIFPKESDDRISIGFLSAAEGLPVSLDASRLVVRHAAIVGSTGSGKTSSVASLLQSFVTGGWSTANIVVVDPHGEYASALGSNAHVLSVIGGAEHSLKVPFWALPAQDIIKIFSGSAGGGTFLNRFIELVGIYRRKFVAGASWLALDSNAVTPDTPVPFDIKEVWFELDTENRETQKTKGDSSTRAILESGDAQSLRSATFQQYGASSIPPHKGPLFNVYGSMPDRLRLGLLDPRLQFFLRPPVSLDGQDPLEGVVREWLGGDRPISVLDFAGVPPEAADAAIGVVLNLLFELALRAPAGGGGIGRLCPALIVLEEAHKYLGKNATELTRESANRIAREGRKYGVGLWLISQRPTELPDTALAQCGTLIALRLTNSSDQGTVKAALPDNVVGLSSVLPSLRTGEAIVSGESTIIPCRVILNRPNPLPLAEDPLLDSWRGLEKKLSFKGALAAWRGIYNGEEK